MIIKTDPLEFASYLEDTSNLKGKASACYFPESVQEVSQIVGDCYAKNIPFTWSGGRTGTTGGCVPLEGVLISLERLNRINEIDVTAKTVRLEAGVSLKQLEQALPAGQAGLTFRPAPTESLAWLGGAVATCASGTRGFGHGSVRAYVRALEIVLPGGGILNIRRGEIRSQGRVFDFAAGGRKYRFSVPSYNMPACKSQAGYFAAPDMDLIDLFIGSEGTLGVVTALELELQSRPFSIFDGLAFFTDEKKAFEFVETVKGLKAKKILRPASLEFLDANALGLAAGKFSFVSCLPAGRQAAVYFEQEADSVPEQARLLEQWAALIDQSGALADKTILADTPQERETLYSFRHALPETINEFLRAHGQVKAAADIAVPDIAFPDMYAFYKEQADKSGLEHVNFGHAGESHLHFNFLPKNEAQAIIAKEYLVLFCRKAVSLGGTVSAEHGIGKIKKPYLKIMYNPEELKQMAAVKKVFDPRGLLGSDNVLDKEVVCE
jgi:D-lactate dehydrogenase (cytochrome)